QCHIVVTPPLSVCARLSRASLERRRLVPASAEPASLKACISRRRRMSQPDLLLLGSEGIGFLRIVLHIAKCSLNSVWHQPAGCIWRMAEVACTLADSPILQ